MVNKSRTLIAILIAVIAIMAAVLAYIFLVSPSITGYAVDMQIEGYQIALSDIIQVVSQCQTFPVTVGEGQTINLVALECLQAPQEQGEFVE